MWLQRKFILSVLKVIFRHPVLGISLVPILPDGRIVLAYRRDTQQWSLPGGMVDWGESIIETTKRELKEETGLNFVKIKRLVGVYSSPFRDPRLHSICIAIAIEVAGNIFIEDTLEITNVKAFTIDDIPMGQLAHDHDRHLTDYLENKLTVA
jgi:8-oxo-dGTP diphosphatase